MIFDYLYHCRYLRELGSPKNLGCNNEGWGPQPFHGRTSGFVIPFGNQTWQWKIAHFNFTVHFPIKASIYNEFSIAIFDWQRVYQISFITHGTLRPGHLAGTKGPFLLVRWRCFSQISFMWSTSPSCRRRTRFDCAKSLPLKRLGNQPPSVTSLGWSIDANCCDRQRVAHPQLNRPPIVNLHSSLMFVGQEQHHYWLMHPWPLPWGPMGPPSRRSMQRKRRVRRRPSNPSEISRAWKRKSCCWPQLLLVFFSWGLGWSLWPCGRTGTTDALDWNPVIPFWNASKLSPGSKPISDWILVEKVMISINHQENLQSNHTKWTDQPQLQDLLGSPEFGPSLGRRSTARIATGCDQKWTNWWSNWWINSQVWRTTCYSAGFFGWFLDHLDPQYPLVN